MKLAARRFPDRIVRRREAPGRRDQFGEWQPGAVERVELRANVQPLSLSDSEMAGGEQLTHRLKAYVLPRAGADRNGRGRASLERRSAHVAW